MITFYSPDGKWSIKIRNDYGMPTKWFETEWTDLKKAPPEHNYSTKEIIGAMKNIAPEIRIGLASKAWNKTK